MVLVGVYQLCSDHSISVHELDRALGIVRGFAAAYPAVVIREPPAKLEMRTNRIKLIAPHPLVRVFGPAEIPDDFVPPLLSFAELEVLHHRLVYQDRLQDVKYLKWLCKSYEGALSKRREKALAAPSKREIQRPSA